MSEGHEVLAQPVVAVDHALAAIEAAAGAAGFAVVARRPVQYGVQIVLGRDGGQPIPVTIYGGKDGVRVVVGGPPAAPERREIEALLTSWSAPPVPDAPVFPPGPWLGSDEAGKGDYFGPLVVAAVYVRPEEEAALRAAGVRDSKLLDDLAARRVAAAVRARCTGRVAEAVLAPAEYNARYAELAQRGENLNHLLADLHARSLAAVLENLAETKASTPAPVAIADRFADERHVHERLAALLQTRGLPLPRLIQTPRAEANVAVAAASILARDRFLAWLEEASARLGVRLPKGGANPAVIAAARAIVAHGGEAALRNVAKLHFATTRRVLARPTGR
jgi:ribonuclease HIII